MDEKIIFHIYKSLVNLDLCHSIKILKTIFILSNKIKYILNFKLKIDLKMCNFKNPGGIFENVRKICQKHMARLSLAISRDLYLLYIFKDNSFK